MMTHKKEEDSYRVSILEEYYVRTELGPAVRTGAFVTTLYGPLGQV